MGGGLPGRVCWWGLVAEKQEPEGDSFSGTDHLQPLDPGSPLCVPALAGSSSENEIWAWRSWNLLDSWRWEAMWGSWTLALALPIPIWAVCRLPSGISDGCLKGDFIQIGSGPSVFPPMALCLVCHLITKIPDCTCVLIRARALLKPTKISRIQCRGTVLIRKHDVFSQCWALCLASSKKRWEEVVFSLPRIHLGNIPCSILIQEIHNSY